MVVCVADAEVVGTVDAVPTDVVVADCDVEPGVWEVEEEPGWPTAAPPSSWLVSMKTIATAAAATITTPTIHAQALLLRSGGGASPYCGAPPGGGGGAPVLTPPRSTSQKFQLVRGDARSRSSCRSIPCPRLTWHQTAGSGAINPESKDSTRSGVRRAWGNRGSPHPSSIARLTPPKGESGFLLRMERNSDA